MTVCIGALSEGGNAVVVASDRMVTASYLAVEFEHQVPKIIRMTPSCIALTAGVVAYKDLLTEVRGMAARLSSPCVAEVATQVKEAYIHSRTKMIEDQHLRPRGITLDEFKGDYMRSWPSELTLMIDRDMMRYDHGLELIIAGVDGRDGPAHIFSVDNPGVLVCHDAVGYYATGSGMTHASVRLMETSVVPDMELKQTLYRVYEAKRVAEMAPGVGMETDMAIISANNVTEVGASTLEAMGKIYEEQVKRTRETEAQAVESLEIEEVSANNETPAQG